MTADAVARLEALVAKGEEQVAACAEILAKMRASRPPGPDDIMQHFSFQHLPEGVMRDTSMLFCDVAELIALTLPPGAERSTALRKLLEGKDAAVRAAMGPR